MYCHYHQPFTPSSSLSSLLKCDCGAFSAEGGKWGFRSGLSYLVIWMGTMMIETDDDDYYEGDDDCDFCDDDFKGEPSNLIC